MHLVQTGLPSNHLNKLSGLNWMENNKTYHFRWKTAAHCSPDVSIIHLPTFNLCSSLCIQPRLRAWSFDKSDRTSDLAVELWRNAVFFCLRILGLVLSKIFLHFFWWIWIVAGLYVFGLLAEVTIWTGLDSESEHCVCLRCFNVDQSHTADMYKVLWQGQVSRDGAAAKTHYENSNYSISSPKIPGHGLHEERGLPIRRQAKDVWRS